VAAHAPAAGARRPADARARTTPRWIRLCPGSPRHPEPNARCLHLQAARSRGHVQHPSAAARSARTGLRQARAETMRSCDEAYGFLTVRRRSCTHVSMRRLWIKKAGAKRKPFAAHAAADTTSTLANSSVVRQVQGCNPHVCVQARSSAEPSQASSSRVFRYLYFPYAESTRCRTLHPEPLPVSTRRKPGVPLEDLPEEHRILISNRIADLLHAAMVVLQQAFRRGHSQLL
jgi:hypothetical protein